VKIRNDSEETINEILLCCDQPDHLHPLIERSTVGKLNMVQIKLKFTRRQVVDVPFIFHAGPPGDHRFHFFVAISGVRSAFAVCHCAVVMTLRVDARISQKPNDTMGQLLHGTIRSDVAGIAFWGVINRNQKVLKTLNTQKQKIARGQSFSFLALSLSETSQKVEPWRLQLMGDAEFALLLTSESSGLLAQQNLAVTQTQAKHRIRIEMGHKFPIGNRIECKVVDETHLWQAVFIKPCPISFVGFQPAQGTPVARWVGKTHWKLSKKNDYTAEFLIAPTQAGVFQINGFVIAKTAEFGEPEDVAVSHVFHVLPA
jgi:hypothetical protein